MFGKFWQLIFGYPHPQSIQVCFKCCFSLTRKCIHQHPIEFYKKLISYVNYTTNPIEGHYPERLWKPHGIQKKCSPKDIIS